MDELQISGRRFISARRIARENGYTSDYIGQLIRGRKIIGQKVGRAWYVDAVSFEAYLGGASAPVVVSAPEISTAPVTPAPDAEKKETEQKNIETSVVVPAPARAEEIKKEEVVVEEPKPIEEKKPEATEGRRIPLHVSHPVVAAQDFPLYSSGLRYLADEEPSFPEIEIKKQQSRNDTTQSAEEDTVAREPFAPARTRTSTRIAVLGVLAITTLAISAYVSSAISLNLNIEAGNSATTYYSIDF